MKYKRLFTVLFMFMLFTAFQTTSENPPVQAAVPSMAGMADEGVFELYRNTGLAATTTFRWQADGSYESGTTEALTNLSGYSLVNIEVDKSGQWTSIQIEKPQGLLTVLHNKDLALAISKEITRSTPLKLGTVLSVNRNPALLSMIIRAYDQAKGGRQTIPVFFIPDIDAVEIRITRLDPVERSVKGRQLKLTPYALAGMDGESMFYADVGNRIILFEIPYESKIYIRRGYEELLQVTNTPITVPIVSLPNSSVPAEYRGAYWSNEQLMKDYPLEKIEVAGTYKQIGCMFGQWYQAQGYVPQPLPADKQELVRAQYVFYEKIYPGAAEQIRGIYASYGLNPDEMRTGIPVYDGVDFSILLPGVIIEKSSLIPAKDGLLMGCADVFTRPEMNADGHARFGRNNDTDYPYRHTALIFTYPESAGHYPTLVMACGEPGFMAIEGINSQGLAGGVASVYIKRQPPKEPAIIHVNAFHLVLEKCATVEEAIALLRSIPITDSRAFGPHHFMLADRGGASVVVEFLPKGIEFSRSDTLYQVMTNNDWAGPANKAACWRYQMAVYKLKGKRGQMDMEGMRSVMSSIHNSTQWTSIYDLQNLSMTLALKNDIFTKQYRFSLADFIARMEKLKTGGKWHYSERQK